MTNGLVPLLPIALSLVPAIAGTARLIELAGHASATPANARFVDAPIPVTLHILSVIPFSMLGALQFATQLRRKRWHRVSGRILAPCALVVALTGLWMAQFYPWPAGDGVALYLMRVVVGSAMAVSVVLSAAAIRRRDFAAHGAWMTRAYALGLGAGTQVLTHLPWFLFVGQPDESVRALLMGSAWVINLVVAERFIRRRLVHPKVSLAHAAQ